MCSKPRHAASEVEGEREDLLGILQYKPVNIVAQYLLTTCGLSKIYGRWCLGQLVASARSCQSAIRSSSPARCFDRLSTEVKVKFCCFFASPNLLPTRGTSHQVSTSLHHVNLALSTTLTNAIAAPTSNQQAKHLDAAA